MNCIFCKIASGDIPSTKVFENDEMVAFKDLNPEAPYHVLFIPKKHIATLNEATTEDFLLIGRILEQMKNYAISEGFEKDGYRIVTNCNENGGQTVFHIHFHLLAGRNLQWPPG